MVTTYFFIGPFSMSFLFGMAMIYYAMKTIEEYFGRNKQADLATLLCFNAVMCLVIGTIVGDYHTMQSPFIFSLIFVWSRLVPNQEMSIWGFPIKSAYLPWVLMVFHLFTGGNPLNDLIGVAAGAVYAYLKSAYRGTYGYGWVDTPLFMHKVVEMLNTIGATPV